MHIAALPAEHVVSYRGVLLTSVPRTVIDLARTLPFAEGVAVADSALHAGLTSKSELAAVIADCPRWPGLQRAREVTAFSDARSESVLESLSRAAFHQAGLPPPDLQVWVGDDDEVIGRVDFLWRRYRTIGEADGAFKYQTPARARTQLERDARLRAAGYEVVHFTWPQITRAPAQVVDAIQVAFRRSRRPSLTGTGTRRRRSAYGSGQAGAPGLSHRPSISRGRGRRPRSSGTPGRCLRPAGSAPASPGPWPPGPRTANCAATPPPGAHPGRVAMGCPATWPMIATMSSTLTSTPVPMFQVPGRPASAAARKALTASPTYT